MPDCIRVSVDLDHAADRITRKSIIGVVMRLGQHVVKGPSNMQTALGLNVGEADLDALVHGGCHGLGFQAFLRDLNAAENFLELGLRCCFPGQFDTNQLV